MKSFSLKADECQRDWCVIDASGVVLGRLAAEIARRLRGKNKPEYTSHMDCGDGVIVINAEKIALTGRKKRNKIYYRHTGYPGGIRKKTAAEIIDGPHPERLLSEAVRRMIPKGPLGRKQLTHLKIYKGAAHPHEGQSPTVFDFAGQNRKNHR